METCEGMGAIVDPHLAEWDYGEYEGLSRSEIDPRWDLFTQGAPGGEMPEQVAKRADQFLKTVASYKGKMAVFSHGHFLRVLAIRFLGLKIGEAKLFLVQPASLSILGYEKNQPAIILWNDVGTFSKDAGDRMHERG